MGSRSFELLLARRREPRLADHRLTATLLAQAAEGLFAAHSITDTGGKALVHGELNPRSLYVTASGYTKILDFETAEMRHAMTSGRGLVRRSWAYLAPEQAARGEPTPQSDIFSLGVVAWEAMTGRRLFKRDSTRKTLEAIRECSIPAPASVRPSIRPELSNAVVRALARHASQRYASARAFAQELERAALAEGPPLTPVGIAAILEEAFAIELGDQRAFVRSARSASSASFQSDLRQPASEMTEEPTQMFNPRARSETKPFPKHLLPLRVEEPTGEAKPAPEVPLEAVPQQFAWQDSSSFIRPLPADARGEQHEESGLQVLAGPAPLAPPTPLAAPPLLVAPEATPVAYRARRRLSGIAAVTAAVAVIIVVTLTRSGSPSEEKVAAKVENEAPLERQRPAKHDAVEDQGIEAAAAILEAAKPASIEPKPISAEAPGTQEPDTPMGRDEHVPALEEDVQPNGVEPRNVEPRNVEPDGVEPRNVEPAKIEQKAIAPKNDRRAHSEPGSETRTRPTPTRRRAPSSPSNRPSNKRSREEPPAKVESGFLTIDSQPFATVVIDGNPHGFTPIVKLRLDAGPHMIRLTTEDGRSKSLRLVIPADDTLRRRVTW